MYLRGFVVALRCNPVYHDLEQMKNIVWMRTDQTGREWKRRMGRGPEKLPCTRCFPELYYTTMTCTWRTATRSRRLCMGLPCFLTNKNRKTGQFFVEGKERDMEVEIECDCGSHARKDNRHKFNCGKKEHL